MGRLFYVLMQGRTQLTTIGSTLLIAAVFVATAVVYWPGLSGDFVFDDTTSLLLNKQLPIHQLNYSDIKTATLSGDAGPLKRPLSMLSFGINYYAADGFDPWSFKLVNLGIHLLNGISLYIFLSVLLRAGQGHPDSEAAAKQNQWLAIAVTAAWLLHPLAITSVLYVVQRMNSLATLFILCGLILYVVGRRQLVEKSGNSGLAAVVIGIFGFGLLATLCKENGVLLPAYALALEMTVFRFRTQSLQSKRFLQILFALTVVLPALAIVSFLVSHPAWIANQYSIRGFSLDERLLTESRVLWLYIKWIVTPNYSQMGLFHDDIAVSTSVLHPLTTALAVAGLALLLIAAFTIRGRAPLVALGILWFFAGHTVESSFLALELVHEHRNYLPMVGILLAVFYCLFAIARKPAIGNLSVVAIIAFIALFGVVTSLRASQWSNNFSLFVSEAQNHPDSVRANYEAGRQYMALYEQNRGDRRLFDQAWHYLERSTKLDNRSTLGFFGLIYLSNIDRRPIDPGLINDLALRLAVTFFGAFENTTLERLAAVNGEREPALSHNAVVTLYDAALSNPTIQPIVRGMLYSSLSGYYANQRHNYAMATSLAIKATEAAPDQAAFNIDYAKLLVVLHQFKAAREQLQIARTKTQDTELLERISVAEMTLEKRPDSKRISPTAPTSTTGIHRSDY